MNVSPPPEPGAAVRPPGPPGPKKIRVLVVDDSVIIRRVVTDVLNAEPELEVVGTAANGRIALEKVATLKPDLVTLDIEMPEMDGLATLTRLRMQHRGLPVIMFSSLTDRAGAITIEALARGASDYVPKPSGSSDLNASEAQVQAELVPKVKALCARVLAGVPLSPVVLSVPPASPTRAPLLHAPAVTPSARPVAPHPPRTSPAGERPAVPGPAPVARTRARVDVLAIGVSTGGPSALGVLLPQVANLPVPIVIVQHMPPLFTRLLADQLNNSTKLAVSEGQPGMLLEPGKVYLAPGDYHMVVERDGARLRLSLNQGSQENSCRPSVDVLFRSVAAMYGAGVLAVVLTGMGNDGTAGARLVQAAGGQVLAQDEASSVVWGMPGAVVRAGLADQVLPLAAMGPAIAALAARPGGR